jgi:hypothetical protein
MRAMSASTALAKLTGIAFTTSPAVTIEEFDKLVAQPRRAGIRLAVTAISAAVLRAGPTLLLDSLARE